MTVAGLRRVLVVQHVAAEPLGTLDALLRQRKIRLRFHNASREPDREPDLAGADAVIVLGGPQNLDEQHKHPHLKLELQMLAKALQQGTPVLGICLGAQLLAHALGAPVGRNRARELGWAEVRLTQAGAEDPALSALGPRNPMFHWHGDTFALPQGCERLAGSELCENQAFAAEGRCYGLQFHAEVDAALIARWVQVYAHEWQGEDGTLTGERILADTQAHVADLQARAAALFGNLLELWGWQPRPQALVLGHRMTGPVAER